MDRMASILSDQLRHAGIFLWQPYPEREGYMIQCHPLTDVTLLLKHQSLLKKYGKTLLGEEEGDLPDIDKILNLCDVVDEKSSRLLITKIANRMRNSGINLFRQYPEFDELVFLEISTNQYITVSLNQFLGRFKKLAYKIGQLSFSDVVDYVTHPHHRRYKKEDILYWENERLKYGTLGSRRRN